MTHELTVLKLTVHRYRGLYVALVAYAAVLAAVARLPHGLVNPIFASLLAILYVMLLIGTLAAFANPDSDLAGDAPALPTYMLRLPVSTHSLALPPLIGATLWPAAAWLVLVFAFLRPYGFVVPSDWPAAMFAAIGPTLIAVQWAPLRSGRLRLALGLSLPMLLVGIGLWHAADQSARPYVVGGFLAVALLANVAAWAGLATSRTSGAGPIERAARPIRARAVRARKDFASPIAAQRWVEWRRQGRVLPLLTSAALALLSLPLLWERGLQRSSDSEGLERNLYVYSAFPTLLLIPVLFATIIGIGARKGDVRGADGAYDPYFSTRPLPAATLVRAKGQVAVLSAVATWVVVLGVALLWGMTPAHQAGWVAPLLVLYLPTLDARTVALSTLGVVLLGALTWRNLAAGAFVDFLPSKVAQRGYAAFVAFTGTALFVLFASNSRDIMAPSSTYLVYAVLGGLLILKLALAAGVAVWVAHLRPTARREMIGAGSTWIVTGGVCALLLASYARQFPDSHLPPVMVEGPGPILFAFLLVPIVRPLIGRWALEVGRHA